MRLLRDARYVTSSVFVALVMTAVRSMLVLQILGPALLGAWKSAMLLYLTGEFARLGVGRGVGIRVPVLAGQGNGGESNRVAAAAGTFTLLTGVILGAAIFGASFFVSNPDVQIAVRFVAAVVGLAQPYNFLRELAAAKHLFLLRAKETLLAAVIDLIAAVALTKLLGLPGMGIATVLAILVPALYLQHRQSFTFPLRADFSRVRDLMGIGFPYSLIEGAMELTRRIDVLLIVMVLGPTWVGYYGVTILIMDFSMQLAQRGVSQVLGPHLLREFGRTGSFTQVTMFYEMPARLFCYVLPPLLGAGTLLIPEFVRWLLPQYVPGIAAAQVTIWSIFFLALHSSVVPFFVAAQKVQAILKLFAVVIPMAAMAQFLVMKAGLGLLGAAWTTVATLALIASCEIYVARRGCQCSRREIAAFLISLYLPLVSSILLQSLVDSLDFLALFPALLVVPIKILLLLVCYTPVLIAYESRFSMLRTVYDTI